MTRETSRRHEHEIARASKLETKDYVHKVQYRLSVTRVRCAKRMYIRNPYRSQFEYRALRCVRVHCRPTETV